MRQKIRIPMMYNMADYIAELSIYFDFSRGKFRLVYYSVLLPLNDDFRVVVISPAWFITLQRSISSFVKIK